MTNTTEWERSFAIEFKQATDELGLPHAQALRSRLEYFVKQLLLKQVQEADINGKRLGREQGAWEERQTLARKIEGMKMGEFGNPDRPFYGTSAARSHARLRNSTLEEVLQVLKERV